MTAVSPTGKQDQMDALNIPRVQAQRDGFQTSLTRSKLPWTGSVLTYMEDHAPCSMDAVLRSGVGKQTETQTSGDQRRCAAILKLHGYENFFDSSDRKRRKWRKREVK